MSVSLESRRAADELARATVPEDIFGDVATLNSIGSIYRAQAKLVHPDVLGSDEAFRKLIALREEADRKVAAKTYGDRKPYVAPAKPDTFEPVEIKTSRTTYKLTARLARGDIADVYATDHGDQSAVMKVAGRPSENDLLVHEMQILRELWKPVSAGAAIMQRYLPQPRDSFALRSGRAPARQANILSRARAGSVTLADIRRVYPRGIDFRDAAWMIRRMLEGLGWVHQTGIVHGAVLPEHVLVHPEEHGAKIIDWSYAVPLNSNITAISAPRRAFYPLEVLGKQPASSATDVYMIARCFLYLLGGTGETSLMSDKLPAKLRGWLQGCLIDNPSRRPYDAHGLHEDLDDILRALVGPPTYRRLEMPAT